MEGDVKHAPQCLLYPLVNVRFIFTGFSLAVFVQFQELQKSIQVSVLKIADGIREDVRKSGDEVCFDPDVIAHVSALVWDIVSDDWTSDLLAFSSHARRETVNVSDVMLIMRKNRHLLEVVSKDADVDISYFVRPMPKRQRLTNKESSRDRRSDKTRRGRPGTAKGATMVGSSFGKLDSGGAANLTSSVLAFDGNVQNKNCQGDSPNKSSSPDLFNTSLNDGHSSDEFFENADPQGSNVALFRETFGRNTVTKFPKTTEGGWSTKFSEFSFFDAVSSPTAVHDIDKGLPSSCDVMSSARSSQSQSTALGKTLKKAENQLLSLTQKLTSYGEADWDQQKFLLATSKTPCSSRDISKMSQEGCPLRQPFPQDYANSDEEFFDL